MSNGARAAWNEIMAGEKVETKNAKIKSVRLGDFDGRFWGAQICFDYGCCGQCVYFGIDRIHELLNVLGLGLWESLPDTNCRVKASECQVFEIGHFMKDRWFKV